MIIAFAASDPIAFEHSEILVPHDDRELDDVSGQAELNFSCSVDVLVCTADSGAEHPYEA